MIHPPWRDARFWLVQGTVLLLAAAHSLLSLRLAPEVAGVPVSLNSSLMLIPVIYASLNFGVGGGLATSLWAAVLVVPNWLVRGLTPEHFWIEVAFIVTLIVVAVVVGRRVTAEEDARRSAEALRDQAQVMGRRYQALFEDQPLPVLIADASGRVVEANSAAVRMCGSKLRDRSIMEILGRSPADLAGDVSGQLDIPTTGDSRRILAFFAKQFQPGASQDAVTQIVLQDVTEEFRRHEEERQLAGRILAVQEEERRRLARDLHDEPLQSLTHLARSLDALSDGVHDAAALGAALREDALVAQQTSLELRKIIQGLRPPILDDLGLIPALRQLTDQAHQRAGHAVALHVTGTVRRLPEHIELTAYRVVQEALSNVVKHARATSCTVRVDYGPTVLLLTIIDDGVGAGGGGGRTGQHGMGLQGMRERVTMCGGTLALGPVTRTGTRVDVSLPLADD